MHSLRRTHPGVSALALIVCGTGIVACAEGHGFRIAPHLQNVTQTAATMIWETAEPGVGMVEYGKDPACTSRAEENAPQTVHRIRLTGLESETVYVYRIRAGAEEATAQFKTAPADERPITFVVVGDSRRWDRRWEETQMESNALQWRPEFFLNMGDLVDDGHEYGLWPGHFQRFAGISQRYMMVTARGNHERSMGGGNDWFARYHELPGEGEPFAAFDWGNTHFVVLSYDHLSEAPEWLDRHLDNVHKKYIIVAQHDPVYCSGYVSPTDERKETGKGLSKLREVLEKHNVTLDLSGHTHIYERSYPLRAGKRDDRNGVTYLVQGGDIGMNYPEWWTAVGDDPATMAKPTYSVIQCADDRIALRSFSWSSMEGKIVPIDYLVLWQDERIPADVLKSLPALKGEDLVRAIEELGAMRYEAAAKTLAAYLEDRHADVSRAAARALRSIGSATVAGDLLPYLAHADTAIRREIARALEIAMPATLADDVAQAAQDANQDPVVRVALTGALQLHATPEKTTAVALSLLADDTPDPVRRRAAYALGCVAQKENAATLAKLFKAEPDQYVMIRLAYTLNRITGVEQNLHPDSPLAHSKPGHRNKYVKKWLEGT